MSDDTDRSPVRDSNAYEYLEPRRSSGIPLIQVNWQVKLVPVTLLSAARGEMQEPFRAALEKVNPDSPLARTH